MHMSAYAEADSRAVITVQFTVRPGQGRPSGFDLGDIHVTGDLGTAQSAGHSPDQGMMIYLSVVQLLDGLGTFLRSSAKSYAFTGVDTSFGLVFRRAKDGLSVATKDGLIARTTTPELAAAIASAAEALSRALPPEDAASSDYQDALSAFRPLASEDRA
ncbi:hypothetical protein GCM10014715_68260 [Streptomyces spiralis]|uniref:Uncharacterized protein n=2 Tax=Streptomyces spiralis TaxID=66376 RepID=A0A919AEP9_9ACTN|nr:hypothetical protein GCM10014715_68260 [Streptomyces spiralis]